MEDKKQLLIEAAREVFRENGFKRTNVSMITEKAEIAVGSFYKYFGSKDDIFLEVYVKENNEVRSSIINTINWDNDIESIVNDLFDYSIDKIWNNNILREWNNSQISDKLHSLYLKDEVKSKYDFHSFLIKLFKERIKEIKLSDDEKNEILKVYDLLYYFDASVVQSNFKDYPKTLKTLIKYFIKGVINN